MIRILVDENSLWLKKHVELFLAQGIYLSFVGQENSPNYGSSDLEILDFCIENKLWIFTENGADFKSLLAQKNYLKKAFDSQVKVIVSKQKYVPDSKVILTRLMKFVDDEKSKDLTFVLLSQYH
jgi:hypothetical protein